MKTKVFISWSGESSRKLADALYRWLPTAFQFIDAYYSPEDIEKGSKWNTEISKELELSQIGILCITHDNTEKPWILFEAGALSKSMTTSHVCPLLFGIEPTDVKGPLTYFQVTKFVKDDFKRLVITINNAAGELQLDSRPLDDIFEMWWPRLDHEVNEILTTHPEKQKSIKRTDRDILEEVLELCRRTVPKNAAQVNQQSFDDLVDSINEVISMMNGPDDERDRIISKVEKQLLSISHDSGVMPRLLNRKSQTFSRLRVHPTPEPRSQQPARYIQLPQPQPWPQPRPQPRPQPGPALGPQHKPQQAQSIRQAIIKVDKENQIAQTLEPQQESKQAPTKQAKQTK